LFRYFIITAALIFIVANCSFAELSGTYYVDTKEPVAASSIEQAPKQATGSCTSILYLLAFGDASIENIAKNAGIKEIKYVDKKTFSILGLFVQDTYTVAGK